VIARHAESILDDAPLDAADAVHNLELVLACYASADQHGRLMEFE